ncbi:dephospho-CoA kinase [Helicobacter sp. MIT 00-7814]|uniref:dephospho-CoA kinase n=1 Tax=unclassified Helicobacter TaxID=2593540 RepID=UPI000E1E835B|nr:MULTISPECIES: dephospho-CoA kinase [unclassified Helicobacter]RDU55108.1 dephospho-CoA kinase [Helicobacter sp. MIT 99-10781]RDU56927.1 dephospho-CoA kinase [Helicobacter sp. MIT 00-7814]
MQTLQYAIALTGCIGSGKSSVASLLKLHGYKVICADSIAHEVLESCAGEVVARFGEGILQEDFASQIPTNKEHAKASNMKVDRKKLGALVFSDENARKDLESILHPKIKENILTQAKELEKSCVPYFLDIPLFFESGAKARYPVAFVAVVYAPRELCLARVKKRDGLDKKSINARLNSQIDIEKKRELADFIITNTQGVKELQNEVEEFLHALEAKFA